MSRGAGRQTLFESDGDYDAFVALLEQARRHVEMRVLAYCVMPNYWHLLLWPQQDDALNHGRPYGGNDWVQETARTLGLERTLHARGNSGRRE